MLKTKHRSAMRKVLLQSVCEASHQCEVDANGRRHPTCACTDTRMSISNRRKTNERERNVFGKENGLSVAMHRKALWPRDCAKQRVTTVSRARIDSMPCCNCDRADACHVGQYNCVDDRHEEGCGRESQHIRRRP